VNTSIRKNKRLSATDIAWHEIDLLTDVFSSYDQLGLQYDVTTRSLSRLEELG